MSEKVKLGYGLLLSHEQKVFLQEHHSRSIRNLYSTRAEFSAENCTLFSCQEARDIALSSIKEKVKLHQEIYELLTGEPWSAGASDEWD